MSESPREDLQSLSDKKLQLAQKEASERPERLQKMRAQVAELFPGEQENMIKLRQEIGESFSVPQAGDHHNEGMFMDTHLDLILSNLERTANGEFPEEVPISVRATLTAVAIANRDVLKKYTYLHDLAKKDRLKLKYMDGRDVELDWQSWKDALPPSADNPVNLLEFVRKQGIMGVSYYHNGKGGMHGETGKKQVEDLGYDGVSLAVLTAIEKHEVAYSFKEFVKPETYGKHLGSLSPGERDLAITASYIDTVSSLGQDGNPNLGNFTRLVISKHNFEVISEVEPALKKAPGLEKKKVESALKNLKELQRRIEESPTDLIARLEKQCRPSEVRSDLLKSGLETLVTQQFITAEEMDIIEPLLMAQNMAELVKRFPKKIKGLKEVLAQAKIQS